MILAFFYLSPALDLPFFPVDKVSFFGEFGVISEKKSKWSAKVMLVLLHVIFVGLIFVLDPDLLWKNNGMPWYYHVLFCWSFNFIVILISVGCINLSISMNYAT